jgi:hypothetical protein
VGVAVPNGVVSNNSLVEDGLGGVARGIIFLAGDISHGLGME